MKHLKNISAISLATLSFATLAQQVSAVDLCPHGGGNATGNVFHGLCSIEFGSALGSVISLLFFIAVLIALGFLIYGGIRWITSGGDKANLETARGTIIAAVIGLIIVFLSYIILNLVMQFFFGSSLLQSFSLPSFGT